MSEKHFTDSSAHSSTHNLPFSSASNSSDRQIGLQWAAQGLIKADLFQQAKYGVYEVADNDELLLHSLQDENFVTLGVNSP